MGTRKRLHTRLTIANYSHLCEYAGANSSISLNDAINRILQEHRETWHKDGTIVAPSVDTSPAKS